MVFPLWYALLDDVDRPVTRGVGAGGRPPVRRQRVRFLRWKKYSTNKIKIVSSHLVFTAKWNRAYFNYVPVLAFVPPALVICPTIPDKIYREHPLPSLQLHIREGQLVPLIGVNFHSVHVSSKIWPRSRHGRVHPSISLSNYASNFCQVVEVNKNWINDIFAISTVILVIAFHFRLQPIKRQADLFYGPSLDSSKSSCAFFYFYGVLK